MKIYTYKQACKKVFETGKKLSELFEPIKIYNKVLWIRK